MIPSQLVQQNLHFLQRLCQSKKRSQLAQCREATDEQLLCLVEICLNILRGRVPLRKSHLRKLRLQAAILRKLSRTRCGRSAKKILQQQGSGLPAVAGLLASIVVPLLTDALTSKNK